MRQPSGLQPEPNSAGVSSTPSTRRQPATAFCASLSTSVPICTGPTKRVTKNRKASSSPSVSPPPIPICTPTTTTAALASPATTSPEENVSATSAWARVAVARCRSMASSMRRPVRSSTAYARIVEAPTTDSDTAPSRSPTRSRTMLYAVETRRWKVRRSRNSGRKQTHTSTVSAQE